MGKKSTFWTAACATVFWFPAAAQTSVWPTVSMSGPAPADELISMAMTRPIPIRKAPPGCAVLHTERYCRADKQPIRSFNVLDQRVTEASSIEAMKIENGCLVVNMKLAVPLASNPGDMCQGGEPKVALKLEVSTRPVRLR